MSNLKEYLVTVEVVTTYQLQCFAESEEDLRLYVDNKEILPADTQVRFKELEQPRIFSEPNIEEVDRYMSVEDVEDVESVFDYDPDLNKNSIPVGQGDAVPSQGGLF